MSTNQNLQSSLAQLKQQHEATLAQKDRIILNLK